MKFPFLKQHTTTLSANNPHRQRSLSAEIVRRTQTIARRDIADWNQARRDAINQDHPSRKRLFELYEDVLLDPKVASKIEQRKLITLGKPWQIVDREGAPDGLAFERLSNDAGFASIIALLLDIPYQGHAILEIHQTPAGLACELIPRQNVIPSRGLVIPDLQTPSNAIKYRQLKEYGRSIIEFGAPDDLGLLNKAVPFALYKRFATSCWSELCEIYGIPPRYIKTDTTDPANVDRAVQMMQEMGANPWWVIDQTEDFGFVNGVATNGTLYNNLIHLCNTEITTLIAGAVIGEDSEVGSRAKEEVGMEILQARALADRVEIERAINRQILPILAQWGLIRDGLRFQYSTEEDTTELWRKTVQALPYFDVDPDWIRKTFGIEVIAPKSKEEAPTLKSPQAVALSQQPYDPFQ